MTVKIRPISKTDSLRRHGWLPEGPWFPWKTNKRSYKKMKSTGIVRKVDELGRIVLPIELRRTLDIAEKDSIEIYVDGSSIILKKYEPTCVFCGDAKNITVYKGKNVCANCIKELKKA